VAEKKWYDVEVTGRQSLRIKAVSEDAVRALIEGQCEIIVHGQGERSLGNELTYEDGELSIDRIELSDKQDD